MKPTISINVNVRNPGHVFACMGLAELATCLIGRQQPCFLWFENPSVLQTQFHISAFRKNGEALTLKNIVAALTAVEVEEMEFNDKEGPIRLGSPFDLIIDWRDAYPRKGLAKTWAGQQSMVYIVRDLLCHLPEATESTLLMTSSVTSGAVTRFNASQAMGALDVGFSLNNLNLYKLPISPFCEFLCLVGLQRACLYEVDRDSRRYALWNTPLSLNTAALVLSTTVSPVKTATFTFDLFKLTSDEKNKYKSFAFARPVYNNPQGDPNHD